MTQALFDHFETLPVGAFARSQSDDLPALLVSVFGPDTLVFPLIECGGTGAWESGHLFAARSATGWSAHVVLDYDPDESDDSGEWARCSRGQRIDRLSRSLRNPIAERAVDLVALASACITEAAEEWTHQTGHAAMDVGPFRGISKFMHGWLLRGILATFDDANRDGAQVLLALSHDPEELAAALRTVAVFDNILANWERDDEATDLFQALAAEDGVTLSGHDVERMQVCEALLAHPHAQWRERAIELLGLNLDYAWMWKAVKEGGAAKAARAAEAAKPKPRRDSYFFLAV